MWCRKNVVKRNGEITAFNHNYVEGKTLAEVVEAILGYMPTKIKTYETRDPGVLMRRLYPKLVAADCDALYLETELGLHYIVLARR